MCEKTAFADVITGEFWLKQKVRQANCCHVEMEPSWKVPLESYCVAKCVSCKINIHFPNCPWGGAPSAGVSNSMLWKDVRHKLKGERGCQGEKKEPTAAAERDKAVFGFCLGRAEGHRACRSCDWPIWSIVFVRIQRQRCFCRTAVAFVRVHGKSSFYYDLFFCECGRIGNDVCVACSTPAVYLWVSQYGANFISTMTSFYHNRCVWPGANSIVWAK